MAVALVFISAARLTGASVLVGHVDVNVRDEAQHGSDDIIATFPRSPHEGRPPLQIGLILHGPVGQEHADRLLQEETVSSCLDYQAHKNGGRGVKELRSQFSPQGQLMLEGLTALLL